MTEPERSLSEEPRERVAPSNRWNISDLSFGLRDNGYLLSFEYGYVVPHNHSITYDNSRADDREVSERIHPADYTRCSPQGGCCAHGR